MLAGRLAVGTFLKALQTDPLALNLARSRTSEGDFYMINVNFGRLLRANQP